MTTTATITSVPTVEFWPPHVQESNNGLFAAIAQGDGWTDVGEGPDRFTIGGVQVRTINYGGENSSGVWEAQWCGDADPDDQIKHGSRPDFPDTFNPIHVWAWDACAATATQDHRYVVENASRWLSLQENNDVETAFAARLINEAGTPETSTSLLDALGQLEAAIAATRLPGYIHVSPYLAPFLSAAMVFKPDAPNSAKLPKTILGSTFVFGAGYGDSLAMTMVATSQPYGWRGDPAVTEAMYEAADGTDTQNQFVAVAERSFAVGYEKLIAAVDVTLT